MLASEDMSDALPDALLPDSPVYLTKRAEQVCQKVRKLRIINLEFETDTSIRCAVTCQYQKTCRTHSPTPLFRTVRSTSPSSAGKATLRNGHLIATRAGGNLGARVNKRRQKQRKRRERLPRNWSKKRKKR